MPPATRCAWTPHAPLALVSGGGWGVGDLRGAIEAALRIDGLQVVVVCGENAPATRRLQRDYAAHDDVRIVGYSDAMPELLGAADVLVHSTGGMTCLEAAAHGCPVVAFGFAHGHVRHNVRAMVAHGLIRHAPSSRELEPALRRALAETPGAAPAIGRPCPGATILGLAGVRRTRDRDRDRRAADDRRPFAHAPLGLRTGHVVPDSAAASTAAAPVQ